MAAKVNLEEIKKIPQDEFKEILHSWMEQKEITQELQKKLRKQLVTDFQKTELAKRLEADKQKNLFNSKDYVVDTLQAEHLYNQNNHFTLSIFFTETRHPTLLPDFEKQKSFRFEKYEIQEMAAMLGLTKTDKITRRILNMYKSSDESLLSVLLKELVKSHKSVEARSVATQTETIQQPSLDISLISSRSKSKRSKRKKNHGLVNQEFKMRKPKKVKDVTVIAQNLEKMSTNIGFISSKLDDFRQDPTGQDESKAIIGHVGTIMGQLNGCISNFESLCRDIKQIGESRNRSFDEWMDDLQNSENGRRFLRKLQKSFSRVVGEEKAKIQKDFRRKLEREKAKLSKLRRAKGGGDAKADDYPATIAKEINEIFHNTCMMIKNVEKESELFEKSLDVDAKATNAEKPKRIASKSRSKTAPPQDNLNLNDCRQIHSAEGSSVKSDPRYSSTSFEDDDSDENN